MSTTAPTLPVDPWTVALAYLPLVQRVARSFRRSPADTDDLVQEGLIGVHDAVGRDDPARGSFERYAAAAARNRMVDWLRWCHRDRRATGDVAEALARPDRLDGPDLADVFAAFAPEGERQRQIVREHFGLKGPARTEAAIGTMLGMSRDAVARAQYRAIGRVRERLGMAS